MGPNIVFLHFKSYFDIRNRAEYRILIVIQNWVGYRILTSKSYFDIQTGTEYRILTFKILFLHSNWDRISYCDIQNPILTIETGTNILF